MKWPKLGASTAVGSALTSSLNRVAVPIGRGEGQATGISSSSPFPWGVMVSSLAPSTSQMFMVGSASYYPYDPSAPYDPYAPPSRPRPAPPASPKPARPPNHTKRFIDMS